MDEVDKYKQRLEAIAEKRRLQEEQDRARREMEDERLRLQQLKRKSLRDQWLMEGPPLSPTSPDAQNPRSPLWGFHAQEIEKRIDKLQSESQRLAEEEEKLKEQMEDGQTEAVKVAKGEAQKVQDTVVQNGENKAAGMVTAEDETKADKSPAVDETAAAVLTNGGGNMKADTSPDASEQHNLSSINGPTEDDVSKGVEQGLNLDVSEAEPGQVPNANLNEEVEEGTLVMRAERVIITEEGDDAPEDLTTNEDHHENVQPEETPLLNQSEAGQDRGEAVEDEVKTEEASETFTQPEKSEATEPTAEAQPANVDVDTQGSEEINENEDEETKAEEQDKQSEDQNSVQVQSPSNALEGTVVASLPVYSQSAFTPEPESEDAAATSPEGAEAATEAQSPATLPGQFQEVPLADPKENQRTEAEPGEQEPLLVQAKAPDTHAEQATANNPTMTETQSLNGAGQGEEIKAPKRKSCQCCSVM